MYYKLMNNDMVVDLLQEIHYVRYLPNSKRWINTDILSANGILSGDGEKVYKLNGKSCAYPEELVSVRLVKIEEAEYNTLAAQLMISQKENQSLREEINALKKQLNEQNSLLQQILAKL